VPDAPHGRPRTLVSRFSTPAFKERPTKSTLTLGLAAASLFAAAQAAHAEDPFVSINTGSSMA
jgi:hypothetical protein